MYTITFIGECDAAQYRFVTLGFLPQECGHDGLTTGRIRRIILTSIEDPYTFDQLKEPRLNILLVKPLVERLYDEDDVSVGKP